MKKQSQNCSGEVEQPISKEKIDTCFTPNGDTYPLCKGKEGNPNCKKCNLYENMVEPYDYV